MNLYLTVSILMSQCYNGPQHGPLTVTPAVYHYGPVTPCVPTASANLEFTVNRQAALLALANGARVWRVDSKLKVVELKRNAKTTYELGEEPMEVKP